jgi:hypothetical protein
MGCSKKEDPTPPAIGTGTLISDGQPISCQVSVSSSSKATTAGQSYDYLLVTMQATPTSASSEVVRIEFGKPAGQPTSAYNLLSITYFTSSSSAGRLYNNATTASLGETSNGVFSGNFFATDYSTPNKGPTCVCSLHILRFALPLTKAIPTRCKAHAMPATLEEKVTQCVRTANLTMPQLTVQMGLLEFQLPTLCCHGDPRLSELACLAKCLGLQPSYFLHSSFLKAGNCNTQKIEIGKAAAHELAAQLGVCRRALKQSQPLVAAK